MSGREAARKGVFVSFETPQNIPEGLDYADLLGCRHAIDGLHDFLLAAMHSVGNRIERSYFCRKCRTTCSAEYPSSLLMAAE